MGECPRCYVSFPGVISPSLVPFLPVCAFCFNAVYIIKLWIFACLMIGLKPFSPFFCLSSFSFSIINPGGGGWGWGGDTEAPSLLKLCTSRNSPVLMLLLPCRNSLYLTLWLDNTILSLMPVFVFLSDLLLIDVVHTQNRPDAQMIAAWHNN